MSSKIHAGSGCQSHESASVNQSPDHILDSFTEEELAPKSFQVMLFHRSKESFVGFMPTRQFLEEFIPVSEGLNDIAEGIEHFPICAEGSVAERQCLFIAMAHRIGLETLQFVNRQDLSNNQLPFRSLKPNIAVYRRSADAKDMELDFKSMEAWIALIETDPFEGISGSGLDLSAIASKDRSEGPTAAEIAVGELISYAVAHVSSGFFTHTFSVAIFGRCARFIRWDRAGAVVSEAFDYSKGKELVEFLLRFDQLSPEQRGRDPSVTLPSDLDRKRAQEAFERWQKARNSYEDCARLTEPLKPEMFIEYHVNDSTTGKTRRYIGAFPARLVSSLQGRATRGAPVFDVDTGLVCYLKDAWRINSNNQPAEGDTYERLRKANVKHVARVVAHGDVIQPETGSQRISNDNRTNYHVTQSDVVSRSNESWCTLKPRLQGYIHYRLVLDLVGRDYTSFRSTKELLSVTIDAIRAHGEAYENAGILHRDISPSNIMITEEGRGFLIDWDLAMHIDGNKANSLLHVGTWPFRSGLLIENPTSKRHEYSDDLESFLHALTYTLIRYTPSNLSPHQIRYLIEATYENKVARFNPGISDGTYSVAKALKLRGRNYIPSRLAFVGRSNLGNGLLRVSWLFEDLYCIVESESDGERVEIAHAYCNKYRGGGGDAFVNKIMEVVSSGEATWSDGPAEAIPLPPSEARLELDGYMGALERYTTSESSDGSDEHSSS